MTVDRDTSAQYLLNRHVTTVVRSIRMLTADIGLFELTDPEGWDLPPFTPGSHVDIHIAPELVRQYSLCGDPADRSRYWIAVRKEEDSRGGSAAMHELVRVGLTLSVSLPRNMFALHATADAHLLVAGGIGITPFLSMVPDLLRREQPFHLHYATRSRALTPFTDLIDPLVQRGVATYHHSDGGGGHPLDVAALLRTVPDGGAAYCCGPTRLIEAFTVASDHWPADMVRVEHFGAMPVDGEPFDLILAASGRTIAVGGGESIAQALIRSGVPVPVACEAGVCGMCKIAYSEGVPEHRDHILSEEERGGFLAACVTRCIGEALTLDL